jgi:N-methylhydantoinase A/oxoprolinase/acetone carboxylase beta subunit
MNYRLGIDVGGTNTDAVILDDDLQVIASTKTHTTADIESGIYQAMQIVIDRSGIDTEKITHAMLGTTQCTNAIVERKNLNKVGVIRLGYPATVSISPYTAWPDDMVSVLSGEFEILHGGAEYDGSSISEFNEQEVRDLLVQWQGQFESIAVVGVFSSIKPEQEQQVAQMIHAVYGDTFPVSLSSTIGSIGLIERENATILNAALHKVIQRTANGFTKSLAHEGVTNAKTYLCQNDGTLMSIEYARQYPILTIGSGPTNSIRGASYLAGVKNAVVLDIGGTTADLGVLTNGFPRESSIAVAVGGIRTNFRMPDIVSIGLGGGSIVSTDNADNIKIGPQSVGYQIEEKALVFGGDVLTTTDIAVRLGKAKVGDPQKVAHLSLDFAKKVEIKIQAMLEAAIDQMKTSSADVDLVLVGGGAIIAPAQLKGVRQIIQNPQGPVANAIGASIAQVSGDFEKIYSYEQTERTAALQNAQQFAEQQAIAAGADQSTLALVEVNETPLAYAPGKTTKVRIKVVGDLIK